MAAEPWRELCPMFPSMEEEVIRECVEGCGGDTERALDVLLNMQSLQDEKEKNSHEEDLDAIKEGQENSDADVNEDEDGDGDDANYAAILQEQVPN
jgi:hypothetical protein